MPSCFVCGRSRNDKTKIEDVTFHRFPTRDNVRNKWKNFILENNLNKKNINKNSVICSKHFDQTLFRTHKTRKFLLANAVPSKIILRVKSAKSAYPEEEVSPPSLSTDIVTNRSFDIGILAKAKSAYPEEEVSPPSLSSDVTNSSFDIVRILTKIPNYDNCGGELATNLNTSFSNANTSDAVRSIEPKVQMPITANECQVLSSTPRLSSTLNFTKHDHCYSEQICSPPSKTNSINTDNLQHTWTKEQKVQVSVTINERGVMPLTPKYSNVRNTSKHDKSCSKQKKYSSFLAACEFAADDSPSKSFLKRGVRQLSDELNLKNKKLKVLQQTIRRQTKKISSMKAIIFKLKKEKSIQR